MDAYENISVLPSFMAHIVATRPYTGEEMAGRHGVCFVSKVESLRAKMNKNQIKQFENEVDRLCRESYYLKKDWFMNIVLSKSNRGRDQLLDVYIPHWLSSFLTGGSLSRLGTPQFDTLKNLFNPSIF